MTGYLMLLLLSFLSFMLIVIVLLQRGRGGGLAGALGGAGGQSAFGTKAGDVFTKITVGMAIIWVLVAGFSINIISWSRTVSYKGGANTTPGLIPGKNKEGAENTGSPELGTSEPLPGITLPGVTGPDEMGTSDLESSLPEGLSIPSGTSTAPGIQPSVTTPTETGTSAVAPPAGTTTAP